jgi:histidine triad (HIT) family protein
LIRKKVFALFILVAACILVSFLRASGSSGSESCPFCDEAVVNRQKFYEDQIVIAMCTHKPIVPSHFLIIPKRHVERLELLTEEERIHIQQAIDKVYQASRSVFEISPYLIHQKNGREVGQSVPHVHFHFIGRRPGDNSMAKFLAKIFWAYLRGPVSPEKMQQVIDQMAPAME